MLSGAPKCLVTFHGGIYGRKSHRMSDCAVPSPVALQMPNDIAGQNDSQYLFSQSTYFKAVFHTLEFNKDKQPRPLPSRSFCVSRERDGQPTKHSQVNTLLLVGTQGRKLVVLLKELENLLQMRSLTTEFIPQKIYQKEMGKNEESQLTKICKLARWYN